MLTYCYEKLIGVMCLPMHCWPFLVDVPSLMLLVLSWAPVGAFEATRLHAVHGCLECKLHTLVLEAMSSSAFRLALLVLHACALVLGGLLSSTLPNASRHLRALDIPAFVVKHLVWELLEPSGGLVSVGNACVSKRTSAVSACMSFEGCCMLRKSAKNVGSGFCGCMRIAYTLV